MTNNERFPRNRIHETALIAQGVDIGEGNTIGPYCVIGFPPEWKGYNDSGKVLIGDNNVITGMATIDSGFDGATVVADGCYIMKGVHIGHNAIIESHVTLSCKAIIGG